MSKKKPLTDEERQAFLDKLTDDQVNPKAEEVFEDVIARDALPKQSKSGKLVDSDSYNDKQTRSRKTEDTSD